MKKIIDYVVLVFITLIIVAQAWFFSILRSNNQVIAEAVNTLARQNATFAGVLNSSGIIIGEDGNIKVNVSLHPVLSEYTDDGYLTPEEITDILK